LLCEKLSNFLLSKALQIGKIINRTSLNENTDAEIFGFEGEFIVAPNENWLFNANLSYLDTELDETQTIDPRDPTQGRQDVSLFKDFVNASNCVVEHNGLGAVSDNAALVAAVQGAGAPYIPTGRDLGTFGGGAPNGLVIPATPGVSDSALTSCAAMAAIAPLFGYEYHEMARRPFAELRRFTRRERLRLALQRQHPRAKKAKPARDGGHDREHLPRNSIRVANLQRCPAGQKTHHHAEVS
jgi:hypothetical protein